jgi:alkylation response protein AidB-like acyl-CoA dehydrogenase
MDITFTKREKEYQEELAAWLKEHLPKDWKKQVKEDAKVFHRWWQRELYEGGWGALNYPEEYGGRTVSAVEQLIFHTEFAKAGAPRPLGESGVNIVGRVLLHYGTQEQRDYFLPKILNGEHIWAQGFSEPNAGSDLAAISTKGVIDGDELVITGQKIWTSHAHLADWMFALVRTDFDAPKHEGISYVLIDLKSPGIELRPIVQISKDRGFNETFMEEVRVPLKNVVGGLNNGWQVATTSLGHERGTFFLARQLGIEKTLNRLIDSFKEQPALYGEPQIERFVDLAIDVHALKALSYRIVSQSQKGQSGPETSVTKLFWSELQQDIFNTAIEEQGAFAAYQEDPDYSIKGHWQLGYLRSRATTIGGGTSEIQRNVIAERILGMPRDK